MALTKATVDAAIEAIIAGAQSFEIEGIAYTQASLSTLWDMRKQLGREEGSGGDPFGFRVRPLKPPEH